LALELLKDDKKWIECLQEALLFQTWLTNYDICF
jgi:hypothetical protein